jgi:hypothetical protein
VISFFGFLVLFSSSSSFAFFGGIFFCLIFLILILPLIVFINFFYFFKLKLPHSSPPLSQDSSLQHPTSQSLLLDPLPPMQQISSLLPHLPVSISILFETAIYILK